ncbi:MAG: DMT family transporter [Bacillota bacterium]|nr:EamA family transporter [Bacillota bacterium]REJ37414.1 MAG: EamA family transporter [Bacillota bacterium]
MGRAPHSRHIYALIALGVAAVSSSAVLVKLSAAPPIPLALYRILLTWLLLLPVILIRSRRELLAPGPRDVGAAIAAGVFLALHYAVWFASLRLTSVASSTVLVTTQPIWVMLLAYLFWREKTAPASLVGIALALAGVYLIGADALREAGGRLVGDFLAVVAAWLVSGYLLIGQRVRRRVQLLVYVFWLYGAAWVTLLIAAVAAGEPLTGYGPREWLIFLGLAVGPTLMGHTVFNWALQHVPASVVAVSILGEPVGATVLARFLLGEVPKPVQIAGGLLILTGILIFLRWRGSEPKPGAELGRGRPASG